MIKRCFDIVLVLITSLLWLPCLVITSVVVLATMGRPLFFCQTRPGRFGTPFTIYKFRTMLNTLNNNGQALPDNLRLTNFGRFLRSTSLDELPELLNVLKGDMSLVGPRPLLQEYLPLYSKEQARRHNVKPGITGWAQVNGRNALNWEDRFRLDVWYVDNFSFLLDIKIIWKTFSTVLRREGINETGHVTMSKFTGEK